MKLIKIAGLAALAVFSTIAMASAADRTPAKVAVAPPPPPPPPPVVAPYSWTGGYAGVTAGYGWGKYTQFDGLGDGVTVDPAGFVGGGVLGYNLQLSMLVVGLETDISNGPGKHAPIGTTGPTPTYNCTTGTCDVDIQYFGTVRGRVGVALNNVLLYGTGGYAYGHFKGGVEGTSFGSSTKSGWTVGGGGEWGFYRNLTVRAEYLFVDLGDADFGFNSGNRFHARGNFSEARLGLNAKF